jgi:thymidylate kinase
VFIIVEGIHDSGKSTLISNIKDEQQDFQIYIGKRLFPELANSKQTNISDFALGTNCAVAWFAKQFSYQVNILFDRLHFSEYAYSIVKRNVPKDIAIEKFKMIDSQLAKSHVKLIFLKCDYQIMKERSKQKNNVYSEDDYSKLTDCFCEACNMSNLNIKIIDTNINDCSKTLEEALYFINYTI